MESVSRRGGAGRGQAGGSWGATPRQVLALFLQVAEPGSTSTGQRSRCWEQRCHGLNFENADARSRDPSLKTRTEAKSHINFEVARDLDNDENSLQLHGLNHGLHLVS